MPPLGKAAELFTGGNSSTGKHKGKTIKEVHEVEPGYYSWFISPNTDFPLYTKQKLREEMDKIKNQNKEEKVSSEDLNSQLEALKSKFSK